MKKILLAAVIGAALILNAFNSRPALAENGSPAYYQTIPPAMLAAVKSAPAASGKTLFEHAAKEYNRMIDQNMKAIPKADRPYLDALTTAMICDSLVKGYRAGHTTAMEEIARRVPVDMSVAEKVDLLELVTTAYLQAESKKR